MADTALTCAVKSEIFTVCQELRAMLQCLWELLGSMFLRIKRTGSPLDDFKITVHKVYFYYIKICYIIKMSCLWKVRSTKWEICVPSAMNLLLIETIRTLTTSSWTQIQFSTVRMRHDAALCGTELRRWSSSQSQQGAKLERGAQSRVTDFVLENHFALWIKNRARAGYESKWCKILCAINGCHPF